MSAHSAVLPTEPRTTLCTDLVRRFIALALLNRAPRCWHQEEQYKAGFLCRPYPMKLEHVEAHLLGRQWLGCRPPSDGRVDRLSFDLDCRTTADLDRRTRLYWDLRELMGRDRVPLVYQTPSGHGLRVVWRIPWTPLEDLMVDSRRGLVADVLRGAGLETHDGILEVYPQRTRIERAMLGRRMPLLDPETLEVLPHADLGDLFHAEMFLGAMEEVERWHAREYDLAGYLRELPRLPLPRVLSAGAPEDGGTLYLFPGEKRRLALSAEYRQLVEYGLHRPSSRYEAEFLVGLALVFCPGLGKGLGWEGRMEDRALATAIATWVATRHNGYSQEWRQSLTAAQGSTARAIDAWTERYLARNRGTGMHTVDRILVVARVLDPTLRYTLWLTLAERRRLHEIAAAAYPPGAQRRRFEIWCYVFQHYVKARLHRLAAAGRPVRVHERDGRNVIHLAISARRMEGWPGGAGRSEQTGRARYVEYREHLTRAGLLRVSIPHDWENEQATLYRIPLPDMRSIVGELPYPPTTLQRMINEINAHSPKVCRGWEISLAEAYQALDAIDRGIDLRAHYLERNAREIRKLVRQIHERATTYPV